MLKRTSCHSITPYYSLLRHLCLLLSLVILAVCLCGCQLFGNNASKSLPPSLIDQGTRVEFQPLTRERYTIERPLRAPHQIYDSITGQYINPTLHLLGDPSDHLETLMQAVEETVAQTYPGSMDTENNRQLLRDYLLPIVYNVPVITDYDAMTPDTAFMYNNPELYSYLPGQQKSVFLDSYGILSIPPIKNWETNSYISPFGQVYWPLILFPASASSKYGISPETASLI